MKKVPLLFLIVFGKYIPRPLGRGMYPPKITLPKQPPFMAGLLIILASAIVFLLSCTNDSGAEGDADGLVIPFVIENRKIIVEATINGKSGRFMFDSGASASVVPEASMSFPLLPSIAFREGIRVQPQYMVRSVDFANGSVRATSWLVRNAGVLGSTGVSRGTEGILGNGIFAGYWVEISFSRNEIVLHQEFPERFAQAQHSPLTIMYINKLCLTIDVDGREVLTFVDTGLSDAVYFPDTFAGGMDRADLRLIASNDYEIGDFHLMQTKSLKIMDMTYSDKLILGNSYIGARGAFEEDAGIGLIGIGFMRYYDLLLDYRSILPHTTNDDSAGMFYIPITAPEERDYGFYSFLDTAPEFGIILATRNRGGIRVNDLLEDSEAYALGLRPDSIITQLDGESVGSFSPDEIRDPYFYDRFTEFTARIDGVEVVLRREQ